MQCRLVHSAAVADQCAYIRTHCPDDEPGFTAYLELYYCSLGHVKPIAFIILMVWLGLLFSTIGIAASDFFCINLSTIATILGMSESLAGVTFLAFGNGSPDLFSTFAAMTTNSSALAIGELFGAACFITAVVAGSMARVRPFKVARKSFVRDVGMFAIAVAFSMGFLSDGYLHLWECIGMVIFYFLYVVIVVAWHWWITKRARKRQRDATARGHYVAPGSEEIEVQEDYLDDPEVAAATTRNTYSRGVSAEDLRLLEGGVPRIEIPGADEDDDDEERELLGEIASSMLLRPGRTRRNTIAPVRPSLFGALEFQGVMKSLGKERSLQTIPMHARRYSEAQVPQINHHGADAATDVPRTAHPDSSVHLLPAPEFTGLQKAMRGRGRAVSAGDALNLHVDPKLFRKRSNLSIKLLDIPEDEDATADRPHITAHGSSNSTVLLSSAEASRTPSPSLSPADHPRSHIAFSPEFLQPPADTFGSNRQASPNDDDDPEQTPRARPKLSLVTTPGRGSKSPRAVSPLSPFPSFHSGTVSIFLPPPASASAESQHFPLDDDSDLGGSRTPTWWPSKTLPPPGILVSTLAPTLCHLREKAWWEIIIGIIAAPSVFLLTITLPVVDGRDDEDEDEKTAVNSQGSGLRKYSDSRSPRIESQDVQASPSAAGTGSASVAAKIEHHQEHTVQASGSQPNTTLHERDQNTQDVIPTNPPLRIPQRWLTIIQLYLAPLFIVFTLYTQYITSDEPFGRAIVRPLLIALLVSTILLIPLLLTTTSTHRPKIYGPVLSLAGFVVSIAWISSIASQVVALLKTFAVILNMSHAILGLTVFAVGNSLGDLVADITVARLGFPVMALSACFGGPMLNILLGIGLSGSYILIRGAQKRHDKHPDRGWKAKPYEIEVGDTLIVSGITLLVTLLGLLIAVPMSGWMMTRRIAWALIAVWCVGTIINVVLEVTGTTSGA